METFLGLSIILPFSFSLFQFLFSLMPRPKSARYTLGNLKCPNSSCQRHFSTDRAVKRHLNHPGSSCYSWGKSLQIPNLQESIRLQSADPLISQHDGTDNHLSSFPAISSESLPPFTDDVETFTGRSDGSALVPEITHSKDAKHSYPRCPPSMEGFEETFLGAAQTHGQGFNIFDYITYCDENAENRESNPYYPFSCFVDWEMARWISRLNIPMYAMDEFFKLKYVCIFRINFCNEEADIITLLLLFRYKIDLYHSNLAVNFEVLLSNSLAHHAGFPQMLSYLVDLVENP